MVRWQLPQEGDPFYEGMVQVTKYLLMVSDECQKLMEGKAPERCKEKAKEIFYGVQGLKSQAGSMLTGIYNKACDELEKEKPCQSKEVQNSDRENTGGR